MSPNQSFIDHAHDFKLNPDTVTKLRKQPVKFGYGGFSEAVLYRTYSRTKDNGTKENFHDITIRVIEGVMTIRKDHYLKHHLNWDESYYQRFARDMALSMLRLEWLPPGRGLWACGTESIYKIGSAALNNCGAVSTKKLIVGVDWSMDMLMLGCGIGFVLGEWTGKVIYPNTMEPEVYVIPDSREGWVESVRRLLAAHIIEEGHDQLEPPVIFDYSAIRRKGTPIKGFGGTASGPKPLMKLHDRIKAYICAYARQQNKCKPGILFEELLRNLRKTDYKQLSEEQFEAKVTVIKALAEDKKKTYDRVRFSADICNAVGCCVVAGNIRRSSEIFLGPVNNKTFLNLKNYEINPERATIGWMSNNSVRLMKTEDFVHLPGIADLIRKNGEPGLLNVLNVNRWGRVGRHVDPHEPYTRELESDPATATNPCGEQPLEPFELCCLAELNLPEIFNVNFTRKRKRGQSENNWDKYESKWFKCIEYATFYASTVSLLPTHRPETNTIMARNHRIGVGITGVAMTNHKIGFTQLTRLLRMGYRQVRQVNIRLAKAAGVPESIRVTTIKPSGTTSSVLGCSPGIHYNLFEYGIRRMRISDTSPILELARKAGYEIEKDKYSDGTYNILFPLHCQDSRPVSEVSIWEQASNQATLQGIWSDNSVSVTLNFTKRDAPEIEQILAHFTRSIKSLSMLPNDEGIYEQAPFVAVSKEEYEARIKNIEPIDWEKYCDGDAEAPKYCDGDKCVAQL